MINSKQLLQDFILKVDTRFDAGEVSSIAHVVLENVFGLTRPQLMTGVSVEKTEEQDRRLSMIAARLNDHEPIQYILNEAYFFGRRFYVDKSVLIPRPETEELVALVLENCQKGALTNPKILDVGTGSGCIAISLALEIPGATLLAVDKSIEALAVAERNAKLLGASIKFLEQDFLTEPIYNEFDIIVSNPPYISLAEKHTISSNVTDFEPHAALFVDEKDPIIFYRMIAQTGIKTLRSGGFVAVEINERFGNETLEIFHQTNYLNAELVKDLSGKDRFVLARKS
jgi:release factor glutamine methyltransferase